MSTLRTRPASHSGRRGGWYSDSPKLLDGQLSEWLKAANGSQVPSPLHVAEIGAAGDTKDAVTMPVKGCRAVIAPHAGYSYSGPAAGWAYGCIDPTGIKRVYILGPSHHVRLGGCALTKCGAYNTPLGDLPIDREATDQLRKSHLFTEMSDSADDDEHSIEMHLPYIRKVFLNENISIVPILVGSTSKKQEREYGALLAPHLADPSNLFVVSSDFCHWGSRFGYTYYRPDSTSKAVDLASSTPASTYARCPIHRSIRALDGEGIIAISHPHSTSGKMKTAEEAQIAFEDYIDTTENTVCGRHPIGVLLGALAELEKQGIKTEARFTRYEVSDLRIVRGWNGTNSIWTLCLAK